MTHPTFFAYITVPRILASDPWQQSALGVISAPVDPTVHTGRRGAPSPAHVGTAIPAGSTTEQPSEPVWRLVIRGVALPGAYLLRSGEFIELGESAEWRGRGNVGVTLEAACQSWRWSRSWGDDLVAEPY